MNVHVDVVDESQRDNGYLAKNRVSHPYAVLCHSVETMVGNVIKRLAGNRIKLLRIFGHAAPGMQAVGGGRWPEDWQVLSVNLFGTLQNRQLLAHLTPHFQGDAVVQLHGCSVGRGWKGHSLIRRLAELWHARVQAALGEQFADLRDVYEGTHYIEADGTTIYRPKASRLEVVRPAPVPVDNSW